MTIGLDASDPLSNAIRTPSSVGLPLQPVTPPGLLMVPAAQIEQFMRGFPLPPGVDRAAAAVVDLSQQQLAALVAGVTSGETQKMLAQFARAGIAVSSTVLQALPGLGGLAGSLLKLSGNAAALLGPAASAIPWVGPEVTTALGVYAPLAVVGGTTVQTVSAVAAAAMAAAQAGQVMAAAAAGAGLDPSDAGRMPDPSAVFTKGPQP